MAKKRKKKVEEYKDTAKQYPWHMFIPLKVPRHGSHQLLNEYPSGVMINNYGNSDRIIFISSFEDGRTRFVFSISKNMFGILNIQEV